MENTASTWKTRVMPHMNTTARSRLQRPAYVAHGRDKASENRSENGIDSLIKNPIGGSTYESLHIYFHIAQHIAGVEKWPAFNSAVQT